MFCPNCGEKNPDDATFCFSCGAKLAPEKTGGQNSRVGLGQKVLIALSIVFLPFLAIIFLLWKKPFSPRANRICLIYCAAITCIVVIVSITSGNQDETNSGQDLAQSEVIDGDVQDVQENELVYDVSQFSKISGVDLISILGKPDNAEEGTCTGAFEIPCVYYDYDNAEGLGDVSFALVNNSVVRFTSYNEYPYKDGEEILGEFGITEGKDCVKVADTSDALRYRCPGDGIDDFRAVEIIGDMFGCLQVTYDMSFYEEWYLPVSDKVDYQIVLEEAVKGLLKAPRSAHFPGPDGWNFGRNPYYMAVSSYVDAQNSFGAEIRSGFEFIYFADTGSIARAIFDGEVIADNGYIETADIIKGLYDAQKQSEALASASAE